MNFQNHYVEKENRNLIIALLFGAVAGAAITAFILSAYTLIFK